MFCPCSLEALFMRWLTRDLWKAGIALAALLLLLALMVWVPVSATGGHEGTSEFPGSVTVTVQTTPTEDLTVTALNKEKLAQEVQQLKSQNETTFFDWLRGNVSILLLGLGAFAGFLRWLADRRDAQDKVLEDRKAERERRDEEQQRWLKDQEAEREKRAEERFQSAVEGLGSEREEARIGAAILLRTFLRPGYEQFYTQTFDLAVAHLRLPRMVAPSKDPNAPLPLTTLSQALSVAFMEAFPLARNIATDAKEAQRAIQSLNASDVQLDHAYLVGADLKQVKLSTAFLREAALWRVNLSGADLWRADFSGADLSKADLSEADLWQADLKEARSLQNADLRGVKGQTEEQLEAFKAKGAII